MQKYKFTTLEDLSTQYFTNNYDRNNEIEEAVFEEIEKLEKKKEYIRAANILSIYVNSVMYEFAELLIDKEKEYVKILIEKKLVHYRGSLDYDDNKILISRKIDSKNIKIIQKYTL